MKLRYARPGNAQFIAKIFVFNMARRKLQREKYTRRDVYISNMCFAFNCLARIDRVIERTIRLRKMRGARSAFDFRVSPLPASLPRPPSAPLPPALLFFPLLLLFFSESLAFSSALFRYRDRRRTAMARLRASRKDGRSGRQGRGTGGGSSVTSLNAKPTPLDIRFTPSARRTTLLSYTRA